MTWLAEQVLAHPSFFAFAALALGAVALYAIIATALTLPRTIHVTHLPPEEDAGDRKRRLRAIVEFERRSIKHGDEPAGQTTKH